MRQTEVERLSYAKDVVKKRKLAEIIMKRYIYTRFILPMLGVCKQFFSTLQYTIDERRQHVLPPHAGKQLLN